MVYLIDIKRNSKFVSMVGESIVKNYKEVVIHSFFDVDNPWKTSVDNFL